MVVNKYPDSPHPTLFFYWVSPLGNPTGSQRTWEPTEAFHKASLAGWKEEDKEWVWRDKWNTLITARLCSLR